MDDLIAKARMMQEAGEALPFSIYSTVREQQLVNVPIIKPLLICVLDGRKRLGEIACPAGSFVILSNRPRIDMRNIPGDGEYRAILIEFDYDDFDCLPSRGMRTEPYVLGEICPTLRKTLQQFLEWAAFAPQAMWPIRRREILQLIYHLGHEQVRAIVEPPSLSHKLHSIVSANIATDLSAEALAGQLAMSESTLRRKLTAEGTSMQAIKDCARLSHALHLLQTSRDPIGRVAERCGYQSQSRFTDKFKQHFGLTPRELRKTRMIE
jgi:AraC-like DNA-binding protein